MAYEEEIYAIDSPIIGDHVSLELHIYHSTTGAP
jgi:hypothetical protein